MVRQQGMFSRVGPLDSDCGLAASPTHNAPMGQEITMKKIDKLALVEAIIRERAVRIAGLKKPIKKMGGKAQRETARRKFTAYRYAVTLANHLATSPQSEVDWDDPILLPKFLLEIPEMKDLLGEALKQRELMGCSHELRGESLIVRNNGDLRAGTRPARRASAHNMGEPQWALLEQLLPQSA